jgi:hypothetical protein
LPKIPNACASSLICGCRSSRPEARIASRNVAPAGRLTLTASTAAGSA